MRSKQVGIDLQECKEDKCKRCATEREVKKSVRFELVKAHERDSILTERYSQDSLYHNIGEAATGNSRHEDHEDLQARLPTSPTTASRGRPLRAVNKEAEYYVLQE
jgi:hypothetical protein